MKGYKSDKPIIGFWAFNDNFYFLDPIISKLGEDFEVKKFSLSRSLAQKFITKILRHPKKPSIRYSIEQFLLNTLGFSAFKKQLRMCDIAWFEWANGPVLQATAFKDINTPIICRLHRYEAYREMPLSINWSKVKLLIFIAESVKESFKSRFPDQYKLVDSVVIRNGVDLTKFKADLTRPRGKNIAYVCRINYIKNLPLLLQCLTTLVKIDTDYMLHVAGAFDGAVLEEYFWDQVEKLGLASNITYSGKMTNEEISVWLRDKDFILMPSIIEGQPVSVLEAMAEGIKPIVYNYFMAEKVFPRKYLFNTVQECVEKILSDDFNRKEYFDFVAANNDLEKICARIKDEIDKLISE